MAPSVGLATGRTCGQEEFKWNGEGQRLTEWAAEDMREDVAMESRSNCFQGGFCRREEVGGNSCWVEETVSRLFFLLFLFFLEIGKIIFLNVDGRCLVEGEK